MFLALGLVINVCWFLAFRIVFLIDNAPSHLKKAENALNAKEMNKKPGGAQPVMRDTFWIDDDGKRHEQKLVDDDGVPKGLKRVLQERGIGDGKCS